MNSKINYAPFKKDFYRISRERLEAYLDILNRATELIKNAQPTDNSEKPNWELIDHAWSNVIDVTNSLYGFKEYEDSEVGGGQFDDVYLYNGSSELENAKFYDIEFMKTKSKDRKRA